ncbi:gamma-glutamylcyclotransferase family protein [Luteimonas saliphila]|uniref:gamma-glutamylcyclotransferase family protein n=1 Tax=Luteimonas saliphila TaxID=2804919 RepID=UPI00192D93C5|nr:gamma-glutamylcyclotransferase family protein [Luteimonas saliphila]
MRIPVDAATVEHLFLYGTLMRGEHAHARFGLSTRAAYVGDACVMGRLHDLGGYPTLVPGEGRVEGEVHRIVDPGLLAELDLYEACDPANEADSDYVRRVVAVPEHGVDAWVYCHRGPPPEGTPLPGPRWRAPSREP